MFKYLKEDDATDFDSPKENAPQERQNDAPEKQYGLNALNSYLCTYLKFKHPKSKNHEKLQTLPVLKNGSSCTDGPDDDVSQNTGAIIIRNTCAFDTVTSILMVAYCDSTEYSAQVNVCNNPFLNFITELVSKGITPKTYSARTEIMINIMQPSLKTDDNKTLANCETTASNIVNSTLRDLPTAFDSVSCSIPTCERAKETTRPVVFITYTTTTGDLKGLQHEIRSRTDEEKNSCRHVNDDSDEPCEGLQTKATKLSPLHLFIDVLNWKEDGGDFSTEAIPPLNVAIKNIPEVLVSSGVSYKLRGVGCFRRGYSHLRTSIGHYFACCKRSSGDWEIYNDLRKKVKRAKPSTVVPCEFIIYTI